MLWCGLVFAQEFPTRPIRLIVPTSPGTGPDVGKYVSGLIPGARFFCINDAAHWPQWEQPQAHDEAVLSFLRE